MLQTRIEELKQYAFVIKQLSSKEHKRKTDETNLGVVWNVLNPLLYMVILSTYYQNVIIHKIENFPVFVFTGISIYNFYNNSTKHAMCSLRSNKNLLLRTKITHWLFIFQSVEASINELLFSIITIIPIMIFYRIPFSVRIFQLVPILILTICVAFGLGMILGVIFIFFPDIEYLYGVFMTMLMFISGTFIPIDHLPYEFQTVLTYNPIFLSIYLTRNSLVYNLESHWTAWVKLLIWAILSILIGSFMYMKNKNKINLKL